VERVVRENQPRPEADLSAAALSERKLNGTDFLRTNLAAAKLCLHKTIVDAAATRADKIAEALSHATAALEGV
jgi:uncharacterized protein YjbI with pentapeptide repeats